MRCIVASWALPALLTGVFVGTAVAGDKPAIGPYDIPTLFFINKSDDKNRVDYGIRLDADCVPSKKNAMFHYWREFENAPPVRTHELNLLDRFAYGIADQRLIGRTASGSEYYFRLKALRRELYVQTTKGPDGRCTALVSAALAGQERAEVLSAYVKLRRPMSVEYVEIHGKDRSTGQTLSERIVP
jgi:hypothetical protein